MSANEWDSYSRDYLIMEWERATKALSEAKNYEMNLRKYIMGKLFPDAKEGTNNLELGNGYKLTAVIKFNYKFESREKVSNMLQAFAGMDEEGITIGRHLVKWQPEPSITEYRKLTGQYKAIADAAIIITDATPSLEIKAPK